MSTLGVSSWHLVPVKDTTAACDVSVKDVLNANSFTVTGVNKNVPGRQKRIVARYNGSAPEFRRRVAAIADAHYDTFLLG